MGKHYYQLTYDDRVAICHLVRAGISKSKISEQLGFHRSTIYREISRNSSSIGYLPIIAARKLKERLKRSYKLNIDKGLRYYVISKLKRSWSPEMIAGRLKLETGGSIISHETIYSYIYSQSGKAKRLYRFLIKKRRFRYPKNARKRKYTGIVGRTPIAERPETINDRSELGHWEGDLMLFQHKTRTNLITLRERKSRFLIAIKNPSRKASITADNIIKYLKKSGKGMANSITFDNGLEFAEHKRIATTLDLRTYFCEPYKSYQKGGIENANAVIRNFLPKSAEIDDYNQSQITRIVDRINNRPMKCLKYNTPSEVINLLTWSRQYDIL